jgi:hypothetical protein
LKELLDGSTTAASTTIAPTPPLASLWYLSLIFCVTCPSSEASLVTAAVDMIRLGKVQFLIVKGENKKGYFIVQPPSNVFV